MVKKNLPTRLQQFGNIDINNLRKYLVFLIRSNSLKSIEEMTAYQETNGKVDKQAFQQNFGTLVKRYVTKLDSRQKS